MAFKFFILHGYFQNLEPKRLHFIRDLLWATHCKQVFYLLYPQSLHLAPIITQLLSGKTGFNTVFSVTLMFGGFPLTVLPKPRSQRGSLRRIQLGCLPFSSTRLRLSLPNQKGQIKCTFFKCPDLIASHITLQLNFCFSHLPSPPDPQLLESKGTLFYSSLYSQCLTHRHSVNVVELNY